MTEVFHLSTFISHTTDRQTISDAVGQSRLPEDVWIIFLSEIARYQTIHPDKPLVVLTTNPTPHDRQMALDWGVIRYAEFTPNVTELVKRLNGEDIT